MTEFVETVAVFTKASGGSVKVQIGPLPEFVMPRETFYKSLAAANAFATQLQREDAETLLVEMRRCRGAVI